MNENDPQEWAAKAEVDWEMAHRALRGKRRFPDAAGYHAQQCAEKYLKALLVSKNIAVPRTHDLDALNELCLAHGVLAAFDRDALDFLSAFAVQVRYPGAEPTLDEARQALEAARAVRAFARRFLGLKG